MVKLYSYSEHKESPSFPHCELIKLTPRLLLQLLGTDCGRDIIHPNIWCNSLFADYKAKGTGAMLESNIYDYSDCEFPSWIITDMRFPNEMKAVEQRNGITIRVNRRYQTVVGQGNGNWATFSQTQFHPSETSLDDAKFDYTIENNGTLEDLIRAVKQILIIEKVI